MHRRELLEKLINAALAVGMFTPWPLASAHPGEPDSDSLTETSQSLQRAMRQLALRDSTEQSTPMFLALENLAAGPAASYPPGSFNAELAARFEHYVDLLLQYKSNPDESDAVALIVLLAQRELVPGSTEPCL